MLAMQVREGNLVIPHFQGSRVLGFFRNRTQTDSGGREEYPEARERTLAKELSKLTP